MYASTRNECITRYSPVSAHLSSAPLRVGSTSPIPTDTEAHTAAPPRPLTVHAVSRSGKNMLTENEDEQISGNVTDMIDLDGFVEHTDTHDYDVYANNNHELSDDTSAASARALIRIVPLAYGGLLGGLADSASLGLLSGLTISVAFDLFMGDNSAVRALFQNMLKYACPTIAGGAQMSARIMKKLGLKVPSRLAEMRCHF